VKKAGDHLQAGVNSLNIKKRKLQMGNIDYENFHLQKRLHNVKPTVPQVGPARHPHRPYRLTVSLSLLNLKSWKS
jgi:hypothetical protein